jgi:flavin reductase (DIM6/NTAB) family NADH-FMN oxidoreductase RutF
MSEDTIQAALKRMPYGFYAITSTASGESNAMVANWVMQSSFSPRMLTLALKKGSYTQGLIETGRVFTVNLFLESDFEALRPYTKGRAKNPDKMAQAVFTPAPVTGCLVLQGAAAFLECEVAAIHDDGGDHILVVGLVVGGDVLKEGEVGDTLTLPKIGWSYAG